MTITQIAEAVEVLVTTNNAEAAHIVRVPADQDDETPQAYVMRARVEGFPIVAICGYVFVPQKDPKPLPVCLTCKEMFENDPWQGGDNDDDRGRLPDA